MNSEFVLGAIFDGILEIPVIKKSNEIKIPKGITPFSERNRILIGLLGRKQVVVYNGKWRGKV